MEKASLYSKLVAKVSVKHIVHPPPGILIIQPPSLQPWNRAGAHPGVGAGGGLVV